MSNKSESTTSLIPKDSKDSKSSSSSSSKKDTNSSNTNKSSSPGCSSSTANKVPTSMADFAQKAKDQGWAAPTPTKPRLDGL